MIGNKLLDLLGHRDPRTALAAAALGHGGAPVAPGSPGAALPGTAPAALGGAALPGTAPAALGGTAPGAQPQAYQSPPDLLQLYTDLTDRQTRERRIDRGIGMLASSFAHPENRDLIAQMMGGNSDASGSSSDALSLIMQIQKAQQEAAADAAKKADRERQLSTLPAIAETYNIDMDTARMLFDNDQIDDFIMEKSKYHPADTSIVKDDSTGKQRLVQNSTGATIMELGGGLNPTDDLQELDRTNAERKAAGMKPYTTDEWLALQANRKKQDTVINNNLGPRADVALLGEIDKGLAARFGSGQSMVDAVTSVQQARRQLTAEGGVIAGNVLTPPTLEVRKVFSSVFGIPDEAVSNTEAFQSSLRGIVRAKIKDLGTGNAISNSDREFLEKEVGANTTLSVDSIMRIMDILEKGERNRLIGLNSDMEGRVQSAEEGSPLKAPGTVQYWEVPDLSPEYLNRIPAGHRQKLLEIVSADPNNAEVKKEFDELYGIGASDQIIRMSNG